MTDERAAVLGVERETLEENEPGTPSFIQEETPYEKERHLNHAKRVIEGLLFTSPEPITLQRISNVLKPYHTLDKTEIKELIEKLGSEYEEQNRAFRLAEIAKGYILRTTEDLCPYIHAFLKISRPERLSHAATEVLAIIAYRGPITRPQVDDIRGVDSSGIVSTLIERELIEPAGKLEVPGRPTLYAVSPKFLKYFGLKDLKDLPDLAIQTGLPRKEKEKELQSTTTAIELVKAINNDEQDPLTPAG